VPGNLLGLGYGERTPHVLPPLMTGLADLRLRLSPPLQNAIAKLEFALGGIKL